MDMQVVNPFFVWSAITSSTQQSFQKNIFHGNCWLFMTIDDQNKQVRTADNYHGNIECSLNSNSQQLPSNFSAIFSIKIFDNCCYIADNCCSPNSFRMAIINCKL